MIFKKKGKNAVFFSLDALIALAIILITLIVIFPTIRYSQIETSIPSDIINVLSDLKVSEINNTYMQSLISQGLVNDLNKSVLEQLGEFYITNLTIAKQLGDSILLELNTKENIGIWFENTLIASKNSTSFDLAENIEVETQIISGIKAGESVTGFSARAFLTKRTPIKYFYFGGYVGDGNVSINIKGGNINAAEIEIAINKDFDILINDIYSGHYENSSSVFTPKIYDLSSYIDNFNNLNNTIKIVGDRAFVAGGFIKVTYDNLSLYEQPTRYDFQGIEGAINYYDGFYIPGTLTDMKIYLHYDSNKSTFLNIGNITVFNGSSDGETTEIIDNSVLSTLLNYNSLSNKTIPLRLGLEETISGASNNSVADVILTTSRVNDMNIVDVLNGTTNISRMDAAKYVDNIFVSEILNSSGGKVGLVSYKSDVPDALGCTEDSNWIEHLTINKSKLKCQIDSYKAKPGERCICCAVKRSRDFLNDSHSNSSRNKFIVLMSDGTAGKTTPDPSKCGENYTGNPGTDAVNQACLAKGEGITVHTVGFGIDANLTLLQEIADCGGGKLFSSTNLSGLEEVYKSIAEDIIEVSYSGQTVTVLGNFSSTLYPDSFIEFNYSKPESPYGLILTVEEQFTDAYSGTLTIPTNSTVLETTVISYSGQRWTDNVEINGISIYNLSEYDENYVRLGDPYAINIPNNYINTTNAIRLTTGINPGNSTQGSVSNKIIYTIIKNLIAFSTISSKAEGCSWDIQFEDDSNITALIPANYTGSNLCSYTVSNLQHDSNDAIQSATFNLLKQLDFDSNNKIDVEFTANDLAIGASEITGIPYSWSTEAQIRRWN